jgi:outer membrane protein assembly factor BamB
VTRDSGSCLPQRSGCDEEENAGLAILVRTMTVIVSSFVLACGGAPATSTDGKPAGLAVVWHVRTQANEVSFFLGTPTISDGVLYLEDGNRVIALDAATGRTLWARGVRQAPIAPARNLVVRSGRVYVSEVDSVLAMDARDGRTIWSFHPETQAVVYASADDKAFYTGQRDVPIVSAFDLVDGHTYWRTNIGEGWAFPGHVTGTAVSGDTVYVAARKWLAQNGYIGQGVLVALDSYDGHELWRYETPGTNGGLEDAPVVAGNLLVTSDLIGNGFFAYDRFARRLVWRVQGRDNGPSNPPVVAGEDVFVGSNDRYVYAVDLQTGTRKWEQSLGGSIGGTAFCQSQIFVQVQMIQRLDPRRGGAYTGALNYDPQTGPFTSNLTTDGKNIYFAGEDGVYAVACG